MCQFPSNIRLTSNHALTSGRCIFGTLNPYLTTNTTKYAGIINE
jgi:hypothetical protein